MSNQQQTPSMMGGKKKSNGHKHSCMCPICKNMMKKKRGGADEETFGADETAITNNTDTLVMDDEVNETVSPTLGGSKRRRTRRLRRKSRRSRKSRRNRRSRRH